MLQASWTVSRCRSQQCTRSCWITWARHRRPSPQRGKSWTLWQTYAVWTSIAFRHPNGTQGAASDGITVGHSRGHARRDVTDRRDQVTDAAVKATGIIGVKELCNVAVAVYATALHLVLACLTKSAPSLQCLRKCRRHPLQIPDLSIVLFAIFLLHGVDAGTVCG